MNKDIMLEKIEYLSSIPHSSLVEYCIYLENENDNYKAQKYITDFISENGIICEKNKEIEQLQQRIDKAIEYIDNNSYEETYTDENGITWLRFKMDNVNDLKDILSGDKENDK